MRDIVKTALGVTLVTCLGVTGIIAFVYPPLIDRLWPLVAPAVWGGAILGFAAFIGTATMFAIPIFVASVLYKWVLAPVEKWMCRALRCSPDNFRACLFFAGLIGVFIYAVFK